MVPFVFIYLNPLSPFVCTWVDGMEYSYVVVLLFFLSVNTIGLRKILFCLKGHDTIPTFDKNKTHTRSNKVKLNTTPSDPQLPKTTTQKH